MGGFGKTLIRSGIVRMLDYLQRVAVYYLLYVFTTIPLSVKVTAYTTETKVHKRTASGLLINKIHSWHLIALSPDLGRFFKFGDKFKLEVDGQVYFVVYQDRMNRRFHNKVDFLLPSNHKCRFFGIKSGKLLLVS
jgi:3D (Asp-Asp-Asp) domain-containing protein